MLGIGRKTEMLGIRELNRRRKFFKKILVKNVGNAEIQGIFMWNAQL